MKKEDFAAMKTEDLLKRKKNLVFLSSLLATTLVVLFVLSLIVSNKQGKFSALTILPFGLAPILILNITQAKEISKELKRRNNSNNE